MVTAPIIAPANQQDTGNDYGAGQPSAVYLDGQFYLIFTDTTGAGALASNGAGQFAWRSSDPTFATGTEVFTAEGWQASTPENNRSFSVANAFSADWQYSDELESFIIAHNNDAGRTTLTFLGTENLAEHPYAPVNIEGVWVEGPGVVSLPDKHAVDDGAEECGRVPVDVIHSSRADGVPPQDLVHKGIDLVAPIDCETPTPTPTEDPTDEPTEDPTDEPTDEPTEEPTQEPTDEPSESPTPTQEPTEDPTPSPSPTDDDDLPDTGAGGTGLLVTLGAALVAGAALLYRYRRGTVA
nr:PT domain-containing protein [Jiangella mangrovi]